MESRAYGIDPSLNLRKGEDCVEGVHIASYSYWMVVVMELCLVSSTMIEELTMHEDDVRFRMVANCLSDDVRSIRGHDSLRF
jgi:hypothetical protein